MHVGILLLACVLTTTAQELITFGAALSSQQLYPNEVSYENFLTTVSIFAWRLD
jgi:hypothetical protein